ncbi:MAG: iron-containing alcohol dehydrogenase [Bacillota bacterium]
MPENFGFHLPTRIEYAAGLIEESGKQISQLTKGREVLVVTDRGVKETGICDRIINSLHKEGFSATVFEQVEPNPKDKDCEKGSEMARQLGADLIVAVGGGSVIDSAKAIALLQTRQGPLSSHAGANKITGAITPLAAVPTTAGTGSEVTRSAVITDTKRKIKMTIKDVALAPKLALVDPETTYSLPAGLTASTGMDALVHAIEAYTCRQANPLSDALALAAIEKIYPALPVAVRDGSNKLARNDLMSGSLMAGLAFSHADVGAVHCMAEAIGSLYDTPHGVANSMFLPVVTAFNARFDPERHARVASICGLAVNNLTAEKKALLLVEKLKQLSAEINIPEFASLSQANPADFEYLAEISAANGSSLSNCRPIKKSDYLKLFQDCYNRRG